MTVQVNGVSHIVPIGKAHDFPDHVLAVLREAGADVVKASDAIGLTAEQKIRMAMHILDNADPELRETIFDQERAKRAAERDAQRVADLAAADVAADQVKQDAAEAEAKRLAEEAAAKDAAAAAEAERLKIEKEADDAAEAARLAQANTPSHSA